MQMHFIFSDNVTLLFDFWTVQTLTGLVLSCLVVLLLTVIYEISKVWKSNLLTKVLLTLPISGRSSPTQPLILDREANLDETSDPLFPGDISIATRSPTVRYVPSTYGWWLLHSSLALLHTGQVILGYMLMLCVMTYNTAIFLAVLLGSGLGYYLAFPLLAKYPKPHSL